MSNKTNLNNHSTKASHLFPQVKQANSKESICQAKTTPNIPYLYQTNLTQQASQRNSNQNKSIPTQSPTL